MLKYLGTIVATAIVILFLLVSSVPLLHWFREEGRSSVLAENRARWASVGLSSYGLTVTVQCACNDLPRDSVLVRVLNERPVNAVMTSDGEEVPVPDDPRFPVTVPSLFSLVEAAIDSSPASFEVEYDDNYGFPRSVFVDPDGDTGDDELRITVPGFDPRIGVPVPPTDSVSLEDYRPSGHDRQASPGAEAAFRPARVTPESQAEA